MIGEKLGSFRIEEVLGTGAMGVVYRASNETSGRLAAVKVISGEISQRGKAYERFRREAEILQQFRHPNIVRFLALGRYKGTSYFAMEYVPGENLEQLLARRGQLPWREVVDLGIQICEALHYAHEHGVVHRDLKPSNLMVSEKGQIKLTDFGIAKDLDATALTATGRTLGTAAYMAPEQIRGTPEVSHKTDLYALGIVFYQMLTGKPAFSGSSAVVLMHSHLNQPPSRPSAIVPEIPVALDDLIIKLMAKAPADRPWDAAAVSVTLTELRDKAQRGEPIPMVWSGAGDKTNPTRAGRDPVKKPKKETVKASRGPVISRAMVETALLVLALVALTGGIAYVVMPPRAAYLYRQAETLMASSHRHDWITARDRFLDPLDRRFPNNPYRQTTRAWRDRILLDESAGRAKILDSAVPILSEPKTEGERLYVAFSGLSRKAIEGKDDLAAVAHWEEMARAIKEDDPNERKWWLLARKRVDELKKAMAERREFVVSQLKRYNLALTTGRINEAVTIREDLLNRYGKYTDLADLLGPFAPPPPSTPDQASTPAAPLPSAPATEPAQPPEAGPATPEPGSNVPPGG
jgi:eukaryotic-like serine/threonine-protein kinase